MTEDQTARLWLLTMTLSSAGLAIVGWVFDDPMLLILAGILLLVRLGLGLAWAIRDVEDEP
jgi:hypothetical protein